jgi:hypothetical protein
MTLQKINRVREETVTSTHNCGSAFHQPFTFTTNNVTEHA